MCLVLPVFLILQLYKSNIDWTLLFCAHLFFVCYVTNLYLCICLEAYSIAVLVLIS